VGVILHQTGSTCSFLEEFQTDINSQYNKENAYITLTLHGLERVIAAAMDCHDSVTFLT